MNDQAQQQFSMQQQSMFYSNTNGLGGGGNGGMGGLLQQQQQQPSNQMNSAPFSNNNGQFNASSASQNNNNFMNMSQYGQIQLQQNQLQQQQQQNGQMSSSFLLPGDPASTPGLQQMNSFALAQTGGSNIPAQFAPHLLQNQTHLLSSVHNQFRQDAVNDWRSALSFQDRNHVVRQFGVAVQNALPPPHQNQTKVENLARGLEQHIYESAESRANYMEKIKDQLTNIERKATEVRNSNSTNNATSGASIDDSQNKIQQQQAQQQMNGGLVAGNSAFVKMEGQQNNQTSVNNAVGGVVTNSLGLDVTGAGANATQNSASPPVAPSDANANSQQNASPSNNGTPLAAAAPEEKQDGAGTGTGADRFINSNTGSGSMLDFSDNAGNLNANPTTNETTGGDQSSNFGESQVNGMKVTLLDLQDSEKDAVRAKMEQIRPTYLRIDALISTLLKHGGDREFDKVRKLTGMKQMLQAQFEVLHQNVFFIRPETLQQLLPSLNQYFGYAEMLGNRSGGNTPILRNQASPALMGQQLAMNSQQPQQQRAGSPMIHPNVLSAQQSQGFVRQGGTTSPLMMNNSPNVRQNMMGGNPQQSMSMPNQMQQHMQPRPMGAPAQQQQVLPHPQQIQQHIQALQNKLMHLQQQLQQVHQMSLNPLGPEQLQNIHMKQQELLRIQQSLTQQLNHYNQLHHVSMAQQRNSMNAQRPVRPPTMMEMNQMQNPMMAGAVRHLNPQMYAQRQAQQIAQQQMNAFQGQARPPMMQQQFQQQPGQNSMLQQQGNPGSLVQTPVFNDFQGSPKMAPSQVGTPQAVNSPADTTASVQVISKTPPKPASFSESSSVNLNAVNVATNAPTSKPSSIQVQSQQQHQKSGPSVSVEQSSAVGPQHNTDKMTGLSFANQQVASQIMNSHLQGMNFMNQASSNQVSRVPSSQQQPISVNTNNNPEDISKKENNLVKAGNESAWADDPFSFGADPLSAGVAGENKEEENVEDFFNWDYEPPSKSANPLSEQDDAFEFLGEPVTEETSHEASPATLEGDATLGDNVGDVGAEAITLKRSREEETLDADETSEKRQKESPMSLQEELDQLAIEYSAVTCTILNTPTANADSCSVSCSIGSLSFCVTLLDRSAYDSGNFSTAKEFTTIQTPDTLTEAVSDLLDASSSSRIGDFIRRVLEKSSSSSF